MRRIAWVLVSLSLGGCGHESPFRYTAVVPNGPYPGAAPLRLTFDVGGDSTPIWLSDGSGLLYSFERGDRRDRDRCLGMLPPDGGSRRFQICSTSGPGADSTDTFVTPALSPGGRLAYFRTARLLTRQAITFVGIGVGTLAVPEAGPLLDNLPRLFPAGLGETAAQIRWLSDSDFLYLAVALPAPFVPTRPLAVVRTRLVADSAVYEIIPNTDTASSIAVKNADAFYYTVRGDPRVFHRDLSTGATTLVHDFGPGRVPASAQVAGSRLTVIIANQIWLVDLADGAETRVPAPGAALGLALAPSGKRLVAVLTTGGNVDLWLFHLP